MNDGWISTAPIAIGAEQGVPQEIQRRVAGRRDALSQSGVESRLTLGVFPTSAPMRKATNDGCLSTTSIHRRAHALFYAVSPNLLCFSIYLSSHPKTKHFPSFHDLQTTEMFDRFFSRERKLRRSAAPNTRPRAPPQPQISTSTALVRRSASIREEEEEEDDVLSELPQLQHISPRASMSSLPSYRSRDTDLPNYKYENGHPLFTLDFLNTEALAAARPVAPKRRPRRAQRPDPALCLAPYSAPGSPFRDVSMSFGWMWMPSRAHKYRGKLIPHDHPVYSMPPSEQARLRRMGIDPVGKAEFMALQSATG